MHTMTTGKTGKTVLTFVLACFLALQATIALPQRVLAASAQDDLRRIEYKYYFRGNYEKTINELRAFLDREDLEPALVVEAREYLAASLILSGSADAGKAEYLKLLHEDSAYRGPDPAVFQPEIIAAFEASKDEYAAMVLRNVPEPAPALAADTKPAPASQPGKPLYKKWWFYAGMAALLLVVAGAAGGGDEEAGPPPERGTVTVEVDVP